MKKEFLDKMTELLKAQKSELMLKATLAEENHVDNHGDEVDAIQANLLMILNSKLNARNKQTIISIEDALERIKNETYGMCKDCEEEIPEKRLLINPYFLTCVGCAESREFNFKSK